MVVCSSYAPRLGGKVAHLRRPVLCTTLRRSTPMCVTPVPCAVRPRVLGSLPVAGRAGRSKVTTDRRTCRLVSAAADEMERHGEGQASGHRSEGHGPNAAGHDVNPGTGLRQWLTIFLTGIFVGKFVNAYYEWLACWALTQSPKRAFNVGALVLPSIFTFINLIKYIIMLFYHVFREGVLKHFVPHLYKDIARSQGTTVAMVQLAVVDPQRHLQQQLQKIVTSAYMSDPDAKHQILKDTTGLLLRNQASLLYGYLEGTHFIDSQRAELHYNSWCSRERTTLRHSNAYLEQRKAPSSLSRDTAMEGQQQVTVVTLLVAARAMAPVPEQITAPTIADMLGRLPLANKKSITSCQVLWTPGDKDASYTSDDLARDYPKMKALRT